MAGVLQGVDRRTQLAGHNRLELLLFLIGDSQRFGVNVFKVKEVIRCPHLTQIPNAHSVVRGVAHLRGQTIPVLDLSMAVGGDAIADGCDGYVIITEYNGTTQGFLVSSVDRIINVGWSDIKAPPQGTGRHSYLTAVTEFEHQIVEIIDIEKVMKEVIGSPETVSEGMIDPELNRDEQHILVVDDSSVARNQIKEALDQLDISCTLAKDGIEALEKMRAWISEGIDLNHYLAMIISDIEMPRMDGYTLTTKIRKDPELRALHVILHTSLSGVFNQAMIEKVGADRFLAKYNPDELATLVRARINERVSIGENAA